MVRLYRRRIESDKILALKQNKKKFEATCGLSSPATSKSEWWRLTYYRFIGSKTTPE